MKTGEIGGKTIKHARADSEVLQQVPASEPGGGEVHAQHIVLGDRAPGEPADGLRVRVCVCVCVCARVGGGVQAAGPRNR